MEYFFNVKKKSTAAHIWTGLDTACKMLSTGGMRKGAKNVHQTDGGRRVCAMCQVNFKKLIGASD